MDSRSDEKDRQLAEFFTRGVNRGMSGPNGLRGGREVVEQDPRSSPWRKDTPSGIGQQ